jgi:Transglycosylase SLT domain
VALLAAAMLLLSTGAVTPDEETTVLAASVGVDPVALQGAVNSTGVAPVVYLAHEGLIDPPATHAVPAPVQAVSARVACIEAKESRGLNVPNARGSGAGGVMQYMPSTFARGAREMGHPEWNLWNPDQARAVAAHDLALGRRSQWTVGGC